MITIIGTYPTSSALLPDAQEAVNSAKRLILQTKRCELAKALEERGASFVTADALYDAAEDFTQLEDSIAEMLKDAGDAVYAVLGAPQRLHVTHVIAKLCVEAGIEVKVLPALSCADMLLSELAGLADATNAQSVYASALEGCELDDGRPLVIMELDNAMLACDVKLRLMEQYPDDWRLYAWDGEKAVQLPLFELDRLPRYDHLCTVFLPALPFESRTRYGWKELYTILKRLRAPGGCPWDAKQTLESMRSSLLEEAYETAEAIDCKDSGMLCEELGDLLMVGMFLAVIEGEHSSFSLGDVTTDVCNKLIYRHPHVFGSDTLKTPQEVLARWEELKRAEKHQQTVASSMKAVCRALPALERSRKVQKRAAQVGFDWPDVSGALEKVHEETAEVEAELGKPETLEMELGDLLFAVVNVCRMSDIAPERALEKACDKFVARFEKVETAAVERGLKLENMPFEALDELWNAAKR